jgi:hypothetical protein
MKKNRLGLLASYFHDSAFSEWCCLHPGLHQDQKSAILQENYNPVINPADFSTRITNLYISMPVGKKMVYEARTEEGTKHIETLKMAINITPNPPG